MGLKPLETIPSVRPWMVALNKVGKGPGLPSWFPSGLHPAAEQ